MVVAMARTRRRSSIVPEIVKGAPEGNGPLRIGAHFVPKGPEHETMSWDYLQRVATADDLDKLVRHSDCESEYVAWAKGIRAHYGRIETYLIKERLGWNPDTLPLVEYNSSDPVFFNDDVSSDVGNNMKVVFNDWPYGVPLDCQHYVVWCKLPIMSPALFATPDTPFSQRELCDILYEAVTADGIRGVTGSTKRRVPVIGYQASKVVRQAFDRGLVDAHAPVQSPLGPTGLGSEADLAEAAHVWAARFVERFVKRYWDPAAYETVYFCNPPHLRTVPGISHFHVISRRKSVDVPNNEVTGNIQ